MSDLRTALEEAFNEETTPVEASEPVTQESSEPVQEQQSDAVRDEKGRFAPKAEKPVESTHESKPAEETQQTEIKQEQPSRKAPSSWKPAAQEAFLKADRGEALTAEEIKILTQEAERRENDFHKGVSEFKSHSERARAYDSAIAPYQEHLNRLGVDAPTAINALMRADVILRTGDPASKAQYFQQLAKEYGIDIGQVQNAPQVDPQTQYLMSQLNDLRHTQQVWQNQLQQQEQMKAQQELSQFANTEKPHFDAVRGDMADLLESGKATSLEQAYEMAVWMRPDIRTTLIEQQRAEAQRKAMEQAQSQRAKTAAVSVKGSSPSAGGVQPVKGSLRDILEANFADNS